MALNRKTVKSRKAKLLQTHTPEKNQRNSKREKLSRLLSTSTRSWTSVCSSSQEWPAREQREKLRDTKSNGNQVFLCNNVRTNSNCAQLTPQASGRISSFRALRRLRHLNRRFTSVTGKCRHRVYNLIEGCLLIRWWQKSAYS